MFKEWILEHLTNAPVGISNTINPRTVQDARDIFLMLGSKRAPFSIEPKIMENVECIRACKRFGKKFRILVEGLSEASNHQRRNVSM